jgi:hypothetical protein
LGKKSHYTYQDLRGLQRCDARLKTLWVTEIKLNKKQSFQSFLTYGKQFLVIDIYYNQKSKPAPPCALTSKEGE